MRIARVDVAVGHPPRSFPYLVFLYAIHPPGDTIPVSTFASAVMGPAISKKLDIDAINRQLADCGAEDIVQWARGQFGHQLVMTTSFGAQAAVMLHLVTQIVPDIPVIWIDTGFNFPETYHFADALTKQLRLNLKVYQSPLSPARMVARHGRIWEQGRRGLEVYDQIRKIEPQKRAMKELGVSAWLTGPRRTQTGFRQTLRYVEPLNRIFKIHPILEWTAQQVHAYLKSHGLAYHPLVDRGYSSIGDWHSTNPVTGGLDDRQGRFRGLKQECGLHLPATQEEDASRNSSGL